MTALPNISEQARTLLRGRRRIALEMLGVGVFVSAYVHVAAGPALYGVATSESVGLFAPTQNRASIELTMSLASRASEASAEAAVRLEKAPDALLEADIAEKARDALAEDPLAAAPADLRHDDIDASRMAVSTSRIERPTDTPELVAPEVDRPAPRPLDRRAETTAPLTAELVAETYSPPRAATVDSPAQLASAVRLGAESENLPELVRNQPPVYPPKALAQGIEGTTIVAAKIGRTGDVLETSIAESSGSPLLDQAAEQAVRTWAFRPALRFGLAVEMKVGVPVVFSIEEALAAERDAATSADGPGVPTGSSR